MVKSLKLQDLQPLTPETVRMIFKRQIGLPLTISEIGATADMIPGITETTVVYPAGYLDLTKEDVAEILRESM
jgi:hypothetical protein